MSELKTYALASILERVKAIIDEKTNNIRFWIKAEISDIKIHRSGHCYIDLVETKKDQTIAQCKATIWASNLTSIQGTLQSDFQNILKKGNQFLFLGEINFHVVYGFSINILAVDLNFSLGDIEAKKQKTIKRLNAEGIQKNNHKVPIVIKKIALIGSVGTDGYKDFYKQLLNNQYGYAFEITDFPVSVQGATAIHEICQQLNNLNQLDFDLVVIIRGGGSKLDLDIFNHYEIVRAIALHNLPIHTGIGHENDVNLVDSWASMSHKTPTALGAYIVEMAFVFEGKINYMWLNINKIKDSFLQNYNNKLKLNVQSLSETISFCQRKRGELHNMVTRINRTSTERINRDNYKLTGANQQLSSSYKSIISAQNLAIQTNVKMLDLYTSKQCTDKLSHIENIKAVIENYHPDNILRLGYAIPLHKGKLLRNQQLIQKDEIEIQLLEKTIVVSYIKTKPKWKTFLMNKPFKS